MKILKLCLSRGVSSRTVLVQDKIQKGNPENFWGDEPFGSSPCTFLVHGCAATVKPGDRPHFLISRVTEVNISSLQDREVIFDVLHGRNNMSIQELERADFSTSAKSTENQSIKSVNITAHRLVAYELVVSPGSGGQHKEAEFLNGTILLNEFINRNSAPVEPQEPQKLKVSTIYFNDHADHLEKVADTQKVFDTALGVKNEKRIHSYKQVCNFVYNFSYNPVFNRVNIEMATTPDQKEVVKRNIQVENEKNLRERYHAAISVVKYILDENGEAYGENCVEPADASFARGAMYRIQHGSPEPERELSTVAGGIKAKRKLAEPNTPLHSKMVVISGPGVAKDTVYTDNFVDIYESDLDSITGKKIIIMTRFASSLSYKEYKERVTSFKSDYFKGNKGPIDAYLLANPIFIDSSVDTRGSQELFAKEFAFQKEAMKEADFQEIMKVCLPFILNYIEVVCSETFNPKEVAIAFNAILNKADSIRKAIADGGKNVIQRAFDVGRTAVNVFKSIKEEISWWGRQVVEQVMVGCGLSGGFSVGGSSFSIGGAIRSLGGIVSSAIKRISGLFSKDKDYCINCGACGEEIRCVVKKGEKCPKCQAVRQC